ncbi:uncharacterized protein LOC121378796 [Gigantopelta aegis]|uniref:uncharacterized protein LOC121378796 n=1 Tax=Gigantopelta aegis TaxID=1735272 RepID=UPI001B88C604|nr:uncharacterized protein LOC121378796 [Gigantopelta aegis]
MGKMTLYHWDGYRSAKIIFMLMEMGVMDDFDIIRLNSLDPDKQAMEEYKKNVHPHGTIPALVIEGETIMLESTSICLFLADKYGKLLPDSKYKHDYYDWIIYCSLTLDSILDTFWHQWKVTPPKYDEATMKNTTKRWDVCINHLTKTLSDGREYICGSSFTAADCTLGYYLDWAENLKDGILLKGHPKVTEYLDRLKKRPAFKESMTYK